MVNLYDDEVVAIYDCVEKVQTKYMGKTVNGENLALLHKELVGRLEDLGFLAEVNVLPCFQGGPVDLVIVDRIEQQAFDFERRQYELKSNRDKNIERPDIEGNV
jgi:hypothetical protein